MWKVLAGAGATACLACAAGAVVYLVATRNPPGTSNPGDLATQAAAEVAPQQPASATQQPAAAETAPEPSATATAAMTATAPSESPPAPVVPAAAPTTAKTAPPLPMPATTKPPPIQTAKGSAQPPKSKKRCEGLKFLERERCLKGR